MSRCLIHSWQRTSEGFACQTCPSKRLFAIKVKSNKAKRAKKRARRSRRDLSIAEIEKRFQAARSALRNRR